MNFSSGRTKEEFLHVIKEWVLPGSIMSDCWKAYDCLSDAGFEHLRVNHSMSFKILTPVTILTPLTVHGQL